MNTVNDVFEIWWLKKYGTAGGPFRNMDAVNLAVKQIAKDAWFNGGAAALDDLGLV